MWTISVQQALIRNILPVPMLSTVQTPGISIMAYNKTFRYLMMLIAIQIYVRKSKLFKTSKFSFPVLGVRVKPFDPHIFLFSGDQIS